MSVYKLIYTSRSTPLITDEVLLDILNKAEVKNYQYKITGLLISYHSNFMQLLEGDQKAVKELFSKIKNDHRHTDINIIFETVSATRSMPTWAMGASIIGSKNVEIGKSAFFLSIQDTRQICESMSGDLSKHFLNFLEVDTSNI